MRTKEIAEKYSIKQDAFERLILQHISEFPRVTNGLRGIIVPDDIVDETVDFFLNYDKRIQEENRQKEQIRIAAEQEDLLKRQELSKILITSGFTFDGYKIVKYSGYISGDDCVTIPRDNFWGTNKVSDNLCGALVKIRRQALQELKEAAYNLGCNAVIGVDFDYLTLDPQHAAALNAALTVYEPYVICVTANGNAVVIEKEE